MSQLVAEAAAQRTATMWEAARYRGLARKQRRLWLFYLESNLFEEARATRLVMLEQLRLAGQQWRLASGEEDV